MLSLRLFTLKPKTWSSATANHPSTFYSLHHRHLHHHHHQLYYNILENKTDVFQLLTGWQLQTTDSIELVDPNFVFIRTFSVSSPSWTTRNLMRTLLPPRSRPTTRATRPGSNSVSATKTPMAVLTLLRRPISQFISWFEANIFFEFIFLTNDYLPFTKALLIMMMVMMMMMMLGCMNVIWECPLCP